MTPLTDDGARDLLARLLADIAPEVDLGAARPDGQLPDELGLDSMDCLNLRIAIHDATGIDIPERDYPSLSTLRGAVGYLASRSG